MDVVVKVYKKTAALYNNRASSVAQCWINGKQLSFLDECSSRMIWANDDYVVKLNDSNKQVDKSIEIWEHLEECDLQYFAPLLQVGKDLNYNISWEVQPKLPLINPDAIDYSGYHIIKYLVDKYMIKDVGNLYNWGVHKYAHIPIIFDWGYRSYV